MSNATKYSAAWDDTRHSEQSNSINMQIGGAKGMVVGVRFDSSHFRWTDPAALCPLIGHLATCAMWHLIALRSRRVSVSVVLLVKD